MKGGVILEKKDALFIEPIAYIRNGYKEKFGVPRQSGLAPSVKSVIEFCEEYRDENCIRDIEQYSNVINGLTSSSYKKIDRLYYDGELDE